jgi:2-oxoglutarate/2-oxoacid ferredoxin oxidoreductase subunit beta
MSETPVYKKKDFISDQEVRWCPGCGDYAILSAMQMAMTKIGKKKEDIVFVSGIGCSSRFPYYMDTYGMHGIHGRAPSLATGLKLQNPNLEVWQITGDGDGLSIGGNHLIHALRRNIDINIVLFNNEIYGLTKGQFSPLSQKGLLTKSSPFGSVDNPFNTALLCLGAGSTFYARTIDTDPKHMMEVFVSASRHRGTSMIEILQNCIIFNDKVHDDYTNRVGRDDHTVRLEHGKPMIFGKDLDKGIILEGVGPKVVDLNDPKLNKEKILIHDEKNDYLANLLANLRGPNFPLPLGVLRKVEAPSYDSMIHEQITQLSEKQGEGKMEKLLNSGDTWEVK